MTAPAAMPAEAPLLELRGIDKRFPGVLANDAVDLTVRAGEIHALLGENGAGKSTLVKIVYGALAPDVGSLRWRGETVRIGGPAAARRLGIGMVFQHFSLFESLSVLENIALALDGARDMPALRQRILEVSAAYGLPLDPSRHLHALSAGERQRVEIVRCLLQRPKLLILDEPTSVLTPQEAEGLFKTLRQLADEGRAILYISHKLDEVRRHCDRATVLRAGAVVGECAPAEETSASLAALMIGRRLPPADGRRAVLRGAPRLRVEKLSLPRRHPFGVDLHEIDFAVHSGEIFGIAGIAGNGQGELMAALSGETPLAAQAAAAICIDGAPVAHLGPAERRRRGAAFVPEERRGHAAVVDMPLSENALLTAHRRLGLVRRGLIDRARARRFADEVIAEFDVRTSGAAAEAGSLSGGNLQKFIVGRELLQEPALLVAAQPTWGVDAGAAATVRRGLMEMAMRGGAVLAISQDLDELLQLCDRLAVICEGRLSAPLAAEAATAEQLGLLMGGAGHSAASA